MSKAIDPKAPVKLKYCWQDGYGLPDCVKDAVWGEPVVIGKGQKSRVLTYEDAEQIVARSRTWTAFEQAEVEFRKRADAPKLRADNGFTVGTFLAIVPMVDGDEKKA